MDRVEIKKRAREVIKNNLWNFWKGYLVLAIILFVIEFALGFIFGISETETCLYVFAGECVVLKTDVASSIASFIASLITAPLTFGFVYYTMQYAKGGKFEVNDIFRYKNKWIPTFLIIFLISLFTSLWSLLFVIPGIIAALSYSMAQYIYVDTEKEPMACIKASKEMMQGYKGNYFLFNLSFIGWIILGVFTLGILYVWLIPYMTTAEILYYEELKKLGN